MKPRQTSILALCCLALFEGGCVHEFSHPAFETGTSDRKSSMEVIDFSRRTLAFKPTRDDFTVGRVVFSLYCSNPKNVRVNGVGLDPAWREIHLSEKGIVVDSRSSVVPEDNQAWVVIDLAPVAKNQFELAPLKIEFPKGEAGPLLCMSVKAWFNEVTNQYDSMYYQNLDDRYALVSYRSREADYPSPVKARFSQNRVATVREFKQALSKPFAIRLNQRPLQEDGAG